MKLSVKNCMPEHVREVRDWEFFLLLIPYIKWNEYSIFRDFAYSIIYPLVVKKTEEFEIHCLMTKT